MELYDRFAREPRVLSRGQLSPRYTIPTRSRHGGFRPLFPTKSNPTPRGEEEPGTPKDTPYRLPRLPKEGEAEVGASQDDIYKVWSRHGYDVYSGSPKPVDLLIVSERGTGTPRPVTMETRRSHPSSSYPRFQQASISPVLSQPRLDAGNVPDPAFYKHGFLPQASRSQSSRVLPSTDGGRHSSSTHFPDLHYDPSPTPVMGQVTRTSSPAKSVRSIHWTLSPVKNQEFDKRGGARAQGPYSREFVRKCRAPNNWMRMKWGRSKTTMV